MSHAVWVLSIKTVNHVYLLQAGSHSPTYPSTTFALIAKGTPSLMFLRLFVVFIFAAAAITPVVALPCPGRVACGSLGRRPK